MTPARLTTLPAAEGVVALTATARGVIEHSFARAARQAYGELVGACVAAGVFDQIRSLISLVPDRPAAADDPMCRFIAGAVFGFDLRTLTGRCLQPAVPLRGTLAWRALDAGRFAVFRHVGPHDTLHRTWRSIYLDWLPTSGHALRGEAAPMEVMANDPATTAAAQLVTEIWLPLA